MKRAAAVGVGLLLALAGCQGVPDEGVGPGPGPAAGRPGLPGAPAIDGRSPAAGQLTRAAYMGSPDGSEWGRLFDNSAAGRSPSSGVAGGWDGRTSPRQAVAYTREPRRRTLSAGEVPAPAPESRRVVLPRPDPALGSTGAASVLAAFDAFQKTTYERVTEVFSRRAWGAAAARGVQGHRPNRVTVHHTDGHKRRGAAEGIAEMRGIQAFHMRDRGWNDIGYHFVIDGEGRVYEGRPADVIGAHSGGNSNMDNIGIAVMGNYNRQELGEAQKTSLRRLITFLALRYHSDTSRRGFIMGHQHYTSTDCPGVHIAAFLDQLRREVDGETRAIAGSIPRVQPGGFVPTSLVAQ